MTEQMLKDALGRIADRSVPIDGLAERALRGAARRRTARRSVTAVAVAVATAVTGSLLLPGGADPMMTETVAPRRGLPTNDPVETKIVQACLRNGSPTGPMGEPRPALGGPSDYRLLVSLKEDAETVAVAGGERGFVLCARQNEENTEPPRLNPWVGATGDLWGFEGEGRVDAIGYLSRVGENGKGSSATKLHHVVVGRVKADVTRVVISWDKGRTVNAVVRNGFFLGRVDSRLVETGRPPTPVSNDDLTEPGRSWEPRDERVLKVEGFSDAGHRLFEMVLTQGGVRSFDPADCTGSLGQTSVLCTGYRSPPPG